MFCTQCGVENPTEAAYCRECGHGMATQAAIWNPNATASWCLLFSPAFGAYLQMLNWTALGEPERAAASKTWFHIGLGMLVLYLILGIAFQHSPGMNSLTRLIGLVYLLTWYYSSGRAQVTYVKEKFGKNYSKRPWSKALLIGCGGIVAYFIVVIIVGIIVGVGTAVTTGGANRF